jgi:hypothetical protein
MYTIYLTVPWVLLKVLPVIAHLAQNRPLAGL